MIDTRRRTRIAGVLLVAFGSLGTVLFLVDSLNEDPAAPGLLQAATAAFLVVAGVRAYRGRNDRWTVAATGVFLAALVLGVLVDAVVRGGFTQPVVDAVFVSLFALPVLVALVLLRTGSAEFAS